MILYFLESENKFLAAKDLNKIGSNKLEDFNIRMIKFNLKNQPLTNQELVSGNGHLAWSKFSYDIKHILGYYK